MEFRSLHPSTIDPFGRFSTIPTINGYNYGYSIKLGSTSITRGAGPSNLGGGGYVRGVSYNIHVPPGPATEPYTMTYAYAMVLGKWHTYFQSATVDFSYTKNACRSTRLRIAQLFPANFQQCFRINGRGATLDSATANK